MTMFPEGYVVVPKNVFFPVTLAFGTGMAYMGYQVYMCTQKCRILNLQMAVISQKLIKLEGDISHFYAEDEIFESSDEEFQDASEAPEEYHPVRRSTVRERPGSFMGDLTKLPMVLPLIDNRIEQGGLQNLRTIYGRLNQLVHLHPKDCEVYWRLAQVGVLLAEEEEMDDPLFPEERQIDLHIKAKTAAENALKCDKESHEAHKWMAITLGNITKNLPLKNQFENGFIIKKHIDAAISRNPDDAKIQHVKGRWCYSVAMLTWIERKLAATLFGNPPSSTLDEALHCFQKAESICPSCSMENLLYLGKVYIAKKEYHKAMNFLKVGEQMTCTRPDDFRSHTEIQQLVKQYKKCDTLDSLCV